MKYEMIFGDEALFDGAPDDVDMIGYSGGFYKNSKDGPMYCCGCTFTTDEYRNKGFIAMRRIIKEPKRWTLEDQKAGRLPEVGAELIHKTRGICEFIGVGLEEDACWALKQQSGSIYIADKSWCQPIETPEERAKREREEWCSKALDSAGILSEMKRYELKRLGEYIGSIHDALQSGELPMPNKESE